ncbi:MAG: hypothetical protein EA397_13725 [Deltaproteobacteria bacterium]|nr:MAG: hypothetical protein EA397_13725 [Deltaproteobacteria bacterium]
MEIVVALLVIFGVSGAGMMVLGLTRMRSEHPPPQVEWVGDEVSAWVVELGLGPALDAVARDLRDLAARPCLPVAADLHAVDEAWYRACRYQLQTIAAELRRGDERHRALSHLLSAVPLSGTTMTPPERALEALRRIDEAQRALGLREVLAA